MKIKNISWKYALIVLSLILALSAYLYASLHIRKQWTTWNPWIFVWIVRFWFPLLTTLSLWISHKIYHSRRNILALLLWWGLIFPLWFVALRLVMGGKYWFEPILGILLLGCLSDLVIRLFFSGISYLFLGWNKVKKNMKSYWITNELTISSIWYYTILFVLHFSSVACILAVIH
jgi:hypothetical protein